MKSIVLLAAFTITYSGNYGDKVEQGSGKVKEEVRVLKSFQGLSLASNFQGHLSTGPSKVVVKADDNILPYIETKISGGVLEVRYKDGVAFKTGNPIQIFVQAPRMESLELSGVSHLTGDIGKQNKLEIESSGGSSVELGRLQLKDLKVSTSGTSQVRFQGLSGQALSLDASGGSTIDAGKLKLQSLDAEASGTSNIQADQLAGQDLAIHSSGGASVEFNDIRMNDVRIQSSGTSNVEILGVSQTVDIDLTGGSRVKADDLKVQEAKVEASGVSSCDLTKAVIVKGELSGGSTVQVAKLAKVDVSQTAVARVVRK